MENQVNKHMGKEFFRYVSVNVLGMIGLSAYILADTFFVSKRLGVNGLAALNFAISVYSVLNGAGLMLGIGGGAGYAIYKAKGEKDTANGIFSASVLMGLVLGVLFCCLGLLGADGLAGLLGAEGEVRVLTGDYLRVILLFAPAFLLNNILIAFVRNDNSPGLSMYAMIAGSLANIILDYLFLFPLDMGITGAAAATAMAPIISILILSSHVWRRRNGFRFLRSQISIRHMLRLVSLGAASFVNETASAITLIVFNLIILNITGNTGVAAYGVVANIALVVIAIFTGIGQGMQPLLSKCHGSGNAAGIKAIRGYGIAVVILTGALVYTVLVLERSAVVSIFNSENSIELAGLAQQGIIIYFIGFLFAGVNLVAASCLSAVGSSGRAFLISLLRGILIIVPSAFLFSHLWGMTGIWCSFVFTEAVTCVVALVSLRGLGSGRNQERVE